MVKLIKFPSVFHLLEDPQSMDIKFSMVTETADGFKQLILPAKCRDFLLDLGWSKHYSKPVKIYGMRYDYATDPFDEDYLKLSLTFPNKKVMENFQEHICYLWETEKKAGVATMTQIIEIDQPRTLVVIADSKWQSAPWKLSLYTFYLKIMAYESPTNLMYPENEYMEVITADKEEKLLSHVTDDFVYYYEELSNNHHLGGFVNTIKPSMFDKWQVAHKHIFGGI